MALDVIAVISSRRMKLFHGSCSLESWQLDLALKGEDPDLAKFTSHMKKAKHCHRMIVDCTASDSPVKLYAQWLAAGIHVVTPNKRLSSGPLQQWQDVRQLQQQGAAQYAYEATVGAGLPIISTLQTLLETGDDVQQIEGVFSGTLSYIFNSFGTGKAFSEVVAEAKQQGYTEPDPRDDLSGMDVARKVTILARECGLQVELAEVPVQSLVPMELRGSSTADEFMEALPQFDGEMQTRAEKAARGDQVLRYVGSVDVRHMKCSVELKDYPLSHPFAGLSGSDNLITFTSSRYNSQPLVVRGPGAGAEVTAAGVFGDILTIAKRLPALRLPM
eukprot:jgi/Astpho2/3647/fgenesh1_pm.00059_%23_1_t